MTTKLRLQPHLSATNELTHDDVIKWKHFLRNWPFVRGIHRSPVNSPHEGQWRGALMFSLICAWIKGWVNSRVAGDLRCICPLWSHCNAQGRTTCTTSMSQNCWKFKYIFLLNKMNSAQQGLTYHHKCTLFSLNNVNVTPDIPHGSVCLNSAPTGPGYNWNDRSDCSAGNETWIFQLTALRWMAEISWNDGTVSWRRKSLRLAAQLSGNFVKCIKVLQKISHATFDQNVLLRICVFLL